MWDLDCEREAMSNVKIYGKMNIVTFDDLLWSSSVSRICLFIFEVWSTCLQCNGDNNKWLTYTYNGFFLHCTTLLKRRAIVYDRNYTGYLPRCICGSSTYKKMWRHNERDGVSNRRRFACLFNRLLRRRSTKASKLRVTGLCEWNPPVTGGFPSQRTSNAKMFPFDDVIMNW